MSVYQLETTQPLTPAQLAAINAVILNMDLPTDDPEDFSDVPESISELVLVE